MCEQVSPRLVEWTKRRPDVAVRTIEINRANCEGIDFDSPVARQYHIHSVPSFRIIGPKGELLAEGDAARTQVLTALHDDLD